MQYKVSFVNAYVTNIANKTKKSYNIKKGGESMPRAKPPKGYLTSTEVKERLNISGAMILNYVKQGKIKHVVPPGRKHGFYLEKDVDRLANELQAFFDLEEEAEKTDFAVATTDDIPACIALNRELFSIANTEDDLTLTKKWSAWLAKNPEIVYVLKRDEEVIGITTVLPFKPGSTRFEEALRGDISFLLGDVKISTEDIEEYKAGSHVQLYIAEIGIKPSLSNTLRRKYGAKLISKFMDTVVDLGRRGIIIEKMTAVGATKSGIKLLQHFGFSEVKFSRPDTRLFIINVEESGAPIIRAYREALNESLEKY